MKSFSVIIPTLNEQFYIPELLADIKKQSLQPKEVIIVDGFSTDKTKTIIKTLFPQYTLLSCPPNVASQRNYGAKIATGKILLFLDADTKLSSNFFKTIIKQFNNSTIACPYYLPHKSNPIIFSVYLFFNLMFFLFQKTSPSGAGSCIIIKKAVFQKNKGFNPDIKFEDIELIRRISKRNQFKMLPTFIWVSDRRFRKYGIIRTTGQYLFLSFLFLLNQFNWSPFDYNFGRFKSVHRRSNT